MDLCESSAGGCVFEDYNGVQFASATPTPGQTLVYRAKLGQQRDLLRAPNTFVGWMITKTGLLSRLSALN
jgi:hypothetical protein